MTIYYGNVSDVQFLKMLTKSRVNKKLKYLTLLLGGNSIFFPRNVL